MKKGVNFLLILVLLGIWGVAAMRFYGNFFKNNFDAPISHTSVSKFNIQKKDTFNLLPLQRDPFFNKLLFEEGKKNNKLPRKSKSPVNKKPVALVKNFPIVEYFGYIKSGASEMYLISINGKIQRLKLNESFEGMKLVKTYKDSVQVSFSGMKKNLSKRKI